MNQGFNVVTKQSDEWQTPAWLFKALDTEFGFTMDGASTDENALLKKHSTSLVPLPWTGERVFCNPPYSDIMPFVRLATDAELAVLLLPVRTDSDWHRFITERGDEIRYLRKRIPFLERLHLEWFGYYTLEQGNPRFPSLIAITKGR